MSIWQVLNEVQDMNNKIEYAKKASTHCKAIKDGISALCQIMDITDDTFNETDRLSDYKSIFSKADAWERQYENYIKKAGVEIEKE